MLGERASKFSLPQLGYQNHRIPVLAISGIECLSSSQDEAKLSCAPLASCGGWIQDNRFVAAALCYRMLGVRMLEQHDNVS